MIPHCCNVYLLIKDIYDHLPRQRQLNESEKKNALELIKLKVNNFLVNISGSTVEAYIDDQSTFSGLFFQDGIMKMVYAAYPEVLLVDATYKLNELRMPV